MATRLNMRNETFGQLVRFAVVGFALAGIYSAIYWYLATYVMTPVLAVARRRPIYVAAKAEVSRIVEPPIECDGRTL